MISDKKKYDLYPVLLRAYMPAGLGAIDRSAPLLSDLEEFINDSNQFFFIPDFIQFKFFFTGTGSEDIIGISPEYESQNFFDAHKLPENCNA